MYFNDERRWRVVGRVSVPGRSLEVLASLPSGGSVGGRLDDPAAALCCDLGESSTGECRAVEEE